MYFFFLNDAATTELYPFPLHDALPIWGRREDAWPVVASPGGAMPINTMLKNFFQRQRPIERARRITLPNSHSFPSGHSLLSAATYPIVAHHFVQHRSVATQEIGRASCRKRV